MAASLFRAVAVVLSTGISAANAAYSISTDAEIKTTAAQLAHDLLIFYDGNETGHTPGILPGPPPAGPYYWWQAGAMFGTLIDYWKLTGDDTYNKITTQAMVHQTGPNEDYMPPNHTASLGNDDQGFWAMTAMSAAENGFPDPPPDQPQWLALAQAVFNTQASPDRHDATCGGGLRWQIPFTNNGYNYKNSISNGIFFNLGARLARYTRNSTYADWAEHTWNWMNSVGLITPTYEVYDGAHVDHNCTDTNKAQFSYNSAVFLLGAAYMYNYTDGSAIWKERLDGLVNATIHHFFPDRIAYEIACETRMSCTTDMLSFKGYVHRWMSTATQIAPHTASVILPVLRASTEAAIKTCTGGDTGRVCGFKWRSGAYDGTYGVGQQMNALGAVSSLLIGRAPAPVTNTTGGTSLGDPSAGSTSEHFDDMPTLITMADKAGAAVVTVLILSLSCVTFGWMAFGDA